MTKSRNSFDNLRRPFGVKQHSAHTAFSAQEIVLEPGAVAGKLPGPQGVSDAALGGNTKRQSIPRTCQTADIVLEGSAHSYGTPEQCSNFEWLKEPALSIKRVTLLGREANSTTGIFEYLVFWMQASIDWKIRYSDSSGTKRFVDKPYSVVIDGPVIFRKAILKHLMPWRWKALLGVMSAARLADKNSEFFIYVMESFEDIRKTIKTSMPLICEGRFDVATLCELYPWRNVVVIDPDAWLT